MAHKDWCGKPCDDCQNSCALDESMPCSPDCDNMNGDGTRDNCKCLKSGCDAIAQEQGRCPVCGNEDLTYGDSDLQDESYMYSWGCTKCGSSGKECHDLVFTTHILD